MLLCEILEDVPYMDIKGNIEIDIDEIYYDSRQVTPNSLFFCIEGFQFDGHDFAAEAVNRGATVLVVEKDVPVSDDVTKIFVEDTRLAMALMSANFFGKPADALYMIGVTGTNGKTSITYLVKSILERSGLKVGLIGTITNMIGNRVIVSERTTPESLDLQRLLAHMKAEGVDVVVMEVSSHSLSLKRVAGCIFDIGIFTNLSQDHLDFHGTMENYMAAKTELFKHSHISVINMDDEYGRTIAKNIDGEIIYYGISSGNCQIYARDIDITHRGVSFTMFLPDDKLRVDLNIPGIFSVYNALAAGAAAYILNIKKDLIKTGLEEVHGIPGRCELLSTDTDYSIIIDYAHTPDGLENILKTARSITENRLITLFGCGGDRDKDKRPIMGEVAGKYSDICIITSDNPRSEDPISIIEDIVPGIKKTKCPYVIIEDRRKAIEYALKIAQKGDVVILAGKGHENYQILKDKTIHFDEREVVAELLQKERI
ncbi:MAG TPA: UDP-N-acetylmuramoyl-L-alanyl-D-glutamate--2,6-diaminopimelate ligase [Clostridiales bacterium]|nr:UDP-N-acetylmuramoyl-L-alanyl-D-glutamate--2,6-diaminopimelate ligase [Clostridiales bacterium]